MNSYTIYNIKLYLKALQMHVADIERGNKSAADADIISDGLVGILGDLGYGPDDFDEGNE